jgi:O-antigen/teichoic acid export membrane protein
LIDRLKSCLHTARNLSSLIDQALVSGGNFLTIAICAHALSLAEQGKFTYIFASYIALLLLNIAGIFQGAAVRAPAQEQRTYKITLARLQLLQAFLLSLLISGIWWMAGGVFGWQASATETWLLFAFLIVQQLADFDRRIAYIFSSTKRVIFSSVVLYPARIIGLLVYQPDTVSEVLAIMIATSLIPALITFITACRSNQGSTQTWINAAKEHLVYSRLFIWGTLLVWLWAYIPVFMLGVMYGKEQVALLGSIRGISNMANVLMEQIETKVAADWARMHHGNGASTLEAAVSRLLKVGMIFWLVSMAVILLFGREIVNLVLGSLYAPHWDLLLIGWIGYGVYFVARILGIKHRTLGANQIEVIGTISADVTAVVAGFVMIPILGVTGAAEVYVVVAVAILASQAHFIRKLKQQ